MIINFFIGILGAALFIGAFTAGAAFGWNVRGKVNAVPPMTEEQRQQIREEREAVYRWNNPDPYGSDSA